MPLGEKYRPDCVFKKRTQSGIECQYPKLIKVCYGCRCYIKNDGDIDKLTKFISLVVSRKSANLAILMSFVSLLISFSMLCIKLYEVKFPSTKKELEKVNSSTVSLSSADNAETKDSIKR